MINRRQNQDTHPLKKAITYGTNIRMRHKNVFGPWQRTPQDNISDKEEDKKIGDKIRYHQECMQHEDKYYSAGITMRHQTHTPSRRYIPPTPREHGHTLRHWRCQWVKYIIKNVIRLHLTEPLQQENLYSHSLKFGTVMINTIYHSWKK